VLFCLEGRGSSGRFDALKTIGAVDIGGTKIAVGAANEDGKIISRTECPTRPELGFADAMDRAKSMLNEIGAEIGDSFRGIGVACPGPLDPVTGIIGEVGTLAGWQGSNLAATLEAEFGAPIAVENDADAATLAEAKCGAGKGSGLLIYVTVSTGIGAGILIDGKLYRGVRGAHPEIGHQTIDASAGSSCYCKATGCWESLASGEAVAAWVQERRPLPKPKSAADICRLAEEGDGLAREAMNRLGYYLGLGLANLITVFAPDTIVLGGGVMRSSHVFLPHAIETLHDVCTQVPVGDTKIAIAELGADVGLVGAAQAWLARYAGR
jgi:glucokinase